jgi:thiamine biosynthesis protein ThiI
MDNTAITHIAEKIGTYAVSILPYQDCCVLFSPEHPILHGTLAEAQRLYRQLDLGSLLLECTRVPDAGKGYDSSQ